MDISNLTIEELLKLRHQISSRISVLRQQRTELGRERRKTVSQRRAQTIRSQLHNGDTVSFRLGVQSYSGTVTRKAEKNAAIEFHDPFAKQQKSHYVAYDRIQLVQNTKGEKMAIVGNVHWIENGKQTAKLVDARVAFRDLEQAKAQVEFAEAQGDKKQIRLARLAFREFQGMRYRGANSAPNSRQSAGAKSGKVSLQRQRLPRLLRRSPRSANRKSS